MRKFIFGAIAVAIVLSIVILRSGEVKEVEIRDEAKPARSDNVKSEEGRQAEAKPARSDDPERLAYWLPEKDSVNHGLVLAAEHLWMFGRESDSVDTYDFDYQMRWWQGCERAVVACFDSIYPSSRLSRFEKADSMVNVISRFFDEDADGTTMGMIINLDLENSFLTFKIAALSKEVIKRDKSFDKECRKWNELHQRMNDFCCGVVGLDWFGGSGAGPAISWMMNDICRDRIADLQNILRYYKDGAVPPATRSDLALDELGKSLSATAKKVTSTEEADWLDDEERRATYDRLYHEMLDARPALLTTAKEWIGLRKNLVRKPSFDAVTADMLKRMAETVSKSSSEW